MTPAIPASSRGRVIEVLGTAPEVLDGEEEGRLTYLGATV